MPCNKQPLSDLKVIHHSGTHHEGITPGKLPHLVRLAVMSSNGLDLSFVDPVTMGSSLTQLGQPLDANAVDVLKMSASFMERGLTLAAVQLRERVLRMNMNVFLDVMMR